MFVLVIVPPMTLSFSSIEVTSLTFDAVPPLLDISLAGVLNFEVGGDPGVSGSGFIYDEICTDLSERLVRSSIDIILGSEKSSSCTGLGRSRLVDVTVRDRLTVMPPSPDVSSSGVDG